MRRLLVLGTALPVLLLAGCAEFFVQRKAQEQAAAGQWGQAMTTLETGVRRYPESVPLRSSLVQIRTEALTSRLAAAQAAWAASQLDVAQAELEAARDLDPGNTRVEALLSQLLAQRRQDDALKEAERRAANGQAEGALRLVEQALKDNPRHTGLAALRRRLEAERRDVLARNSTGLLAEQRPISLDFRDASIRTVLEVVTRHSGINFVLDRDIRPDARVTLLLRNTRVEDALDLLVDTAQLARKVVDAQTIVIYPNTPEKQREYQEQVVRVFYPASSEAKGLAAFLRSMLNIREPFVDERSNMLAVRESPENVRLVERLVALYDAGDPEVLLEVEVLEINSSRLTELGVKLPDTFSLTALPPSGASGLTLRSAGELNRDRIALGVGGVTVNLKREVGDFTTLANPRIRSRNKEKAKILIGDKIPVVTTTTGVGGFVAENVNYLEVGLKLEVEPTVYANDEVAIRVALEVSSVGTPVRTAAGSLAYQIGTRNASTLLRLRDGETQLLAGLISRDERTSASRVPGIGDLPLLGRLFSSQRDQGQRTELVLAITPRVLRNILRPDASESEVWVGTEALPRLRTPRAPAVAAPQPQPQSRPQSQPQPQPEEDS